MGQSGMLSEQRRSAGGKIQERGRGRRHGIDTVKEGRFMSDLDRLRIWDDSAVRGALSWYLDVAENRRPAKFRIAATVATKVDPAVSGEDALWAELDRLTPIFLARWRAVRTGQRLPPAVDGPSLLELCRELAH